MPRSDPSILAILAVKNEGAFLLDWLAHHRAAGFTDILVLSNDCEDGTDEMLDRLAAMGWLAHVRNDGAHPKGPQWTALARADDHPLTAAADWVLVLDIDEFVNVHAGDRTVQALLAALPGATAIPLTWRLFGNCGVRAFEDRPPTGQFLRAAPAVMGWPWRAAMFKTLFRNDGSYGKLGVHRPRKPDPARLGHQRWFDGSGRELRRAFHTGRVFSDYGQDNYRLVQLNHYALGAMESYVLKCHRGRANREASATDLSYWVERNFCAEEDRSVLELSARIRPIRAELSADAVLGRLHAAAVAWRRRRFETLMGSEEWRGLFGRLMMAGPSRTLSPEEHGIMAAYAARATAETERDGDAG